MIDIMKYGYLYDTVEEFKQARKLVKEAINTISNPLELDEYILELVIAQEKKVNECGKCCFRNAHRCIVSFEKVSKYDSGCDYFRQGKYVDTYLWEIIIAWQSFWNSDNWCLDEMKDKVTECNELE